MDIGEVMRRCRAHLKMSQNQLAEAAGVHTRQIRRYEAGEQQPLLPVAIAIAEALGISVDELAGVARHSGDLSGDWWFGWRSVKDGSEVIVVQQVRLKRQGDVILVQSLTRGCSVDDGGYHWRGELTLWEDELLVGWFDAAEAGVRSKGSLFFLRDPQLGHLIGQWVGRSNRRSVDHGWCVMAPARADVHGLLRLDAASGDLVDPESATPSSRTR